MTTAEDDLLFCLLHDDRVASPLAQIFDPTWLNLDIPAGRILAKIMAETKADGPVEANRMEEFLEDDLERTCISTKLFQEVSSFDENSFLQHTNECLLAFSSAQLNKKKRRFSTTSINHRSERLTKHFESELQQLRKTEKIPQINFL